MSPLRLPAAVGLCGLKTGLTEIRFGYRSHLRLEFGYWGYGCVRLWAVELCGGVPRRHGAEIETGHDSLR